MTERQIPCLGLRTINLKLDGLCYADIAEIRDAISERRHKLWLDRIKGLNRRKTEKKTVAELEALRIKVFSDLHNEFDPIGRCNRILNSIQRFEDSLK